MRGPGRGARARHVHRDLKPANFFLPRRADGSPLLKILDFGISKVPAAVDELLTNTQALLGTPAYMSPEQMRSSRQVDQRSDIWALGVVLYELIEGRRPFRGASYAELCLMVGMDEVPPLRTAMSSGLASAIMRCLEKQPEQRFQNVAELAAALAPYAQTPAQAASSTERTARILGVQAPPAEAMSAAAPPAKAMPVAAPPAVPSRAASQGMPGAGDPRPYSAPPGTLTNGTWLLDHAGTERTPSRRLLIIALAAGGVLAAAVLAFALAGRGEPSNAGPAPAASPAMDAGSEPSAARAIVADASIPAASVTDAGKDVAAAIAPDAAPEPRKASTPSSERPRRKTSDKPKVHADKPRTGPRPTETAKPEKDDITDLPWK